MRYSFNPQPTLPGKSGYLNPTSWIEFDWARGYVGKESGSYERGDLAPHRPSNAQATLRPATTVLVSARYLIQSGMGRPASRWNSAITWRAVSTAQRAVSAFRRSAIVGGGLAARRSSRSASPS